MTKLNTDNDEAVEVYEDDSEDVPRFVGNSQDEVDK
jgi:hypothetical protein